MYVQNLNSFNLICEEMFEDTKGITRSRKSKNMCIYWEKDIKQRLNFSTNMLYSTSIEMKYWIQNRRKNKALLFCFNISNCDENITSMFVSH